MGRQTVENTLVRGGVENTFYRALNTLQLMGRQTVENTLIRYVFVLIVENTLIRYDAIYYSPTLATH